MARTSSRTLLLQRPPATPAAPSAAALSHTAAAQTLLGAFGRHGDDRTAQPCFILSTEGLDPEPLMRLLGPDRISRFGVRCCELVRVLG